MNDGEISKLTRMEIRDGEKCFVIDLPGGEFSGVCGDRPNAQTLIAWGNAVRSELENREAASRRQVSEELEAETVQPESTADGGPTQDSASTETAAPAPDDPRAFVIRGHEQASRQFERAALNYERAKAQLETWAVLFNALPTEESEEDESDRLEE